MNHMTAAQAAQQNNRDNGGKYATKEQAEVAGVGLTEPVGFTGVAEAIEEAKTTGKPVRISHIDGNRFDDGVGNTACGDYSLGAEPSVSATWATGRDDEPFITVDYYAYVTAYDFNSVKELDEYDLDEANAANEEAIDAGEELPHDIRFGVDTMTMWTAHTDLDGVGDTEVRADVVHVNAALMPYRNLGDAEHSARRQILREDFEHFHPENWK